MVLFLTVLIAGCLGLGYHYGSWARIPMPWLVVTSITLGFSVDALYHQVSHSGQGVWDLFLTLPIGAMAFLTLIRLGIWLHHPDVGGVEKG